MIIKDDERNSEIEVKDILRPEMELLSCHFALTGFCDRFWHQPQGRREEQEALLPPPPHVPDLVESKEKPKSKTMFLLELWMMILVGVSLGVQKMMLWMSILRQPLEIIRNCKMDSRKQKRRKNSLYTDTITIFMTVMMVLSDPVEGVGHSPNGVDDEGVVPLGPSSGGLESKVGEALKDVVVQRASGCYLFLVSTTESPPLLLPLVRRWHETDQSVLELNLHAASRDVMSTWSGDFVHRVFEETACWAIVLDLSVRGDVVLRFMDFNQLYYWPDIPVIAVGSRGDAENFLVQERALRNSVESLYLSYSENVAAYFRQKFSSPTTTTSFPDAGIGVVSQRREIESSGDENLQILARCLFCRSGNPGIRFLYQWNLGHQLPYTIVPLDETKNFNGYHVRVVCLLRIPYITYTKDWEGPEGTVQPLDSFEFRITRTAAKVFNFTFSVREPWDGQWGLPDVHGNFSGIVGTLQYEKADFSYLLTPLPVRLLGMNIGGVFIDDPFLILSHEPGPLPKSLAIVAPFTDWVWIGVVASCFAYSLALWLLQKGRVAFFKEKGMDLVYSFFYVIRIILEDPPLSVPPQLSSQLLLGWWWMACLVIMSAYRSALISHLTVTKTYDAINSMEDLWRREDMTWGSIHMKKSGASFLYLSTNPNPVIRKVAEKIETLPSDVHLDRVLTGKYAYITRNSWALTDLLRTETENLPIHISITKYPVSCGYTWGFRIGSPLRKPIDKLQRRLRETGLTEIWLKEIVTDIALKVSQESDKKLQSTAESAGQDSRQRVLTMEHLQGAFILLLLGYGLGFLCLLSEILRFVCTKESNESTG